MKLNLATKNILKEFSFLSAAEKFEKNELAIGLAGVIFVSILGGTVFYFNAYKVAKYEPKIGIEEISVDRELLKSAVSGLSEKSKFLPQENIIDPFR